MTRTHFRDEADAWDWLECEVDDPCIDNYRLAYLDDPDGMNGYYESQRHGCCGSADYDITIGDRPAMIGCNYGH